MSKWFRLCAILSLVALWAVVPAWAADRERLLSDPGVYGTFAAFEMDHEWWELGGDARVVAVTEVKGLLDRWSEKVLIDSYLLRGLSDHADLMFRLHAFSLADTQQFLVALQGTRFGRHLKPASLFHGLTKKPNYVPGFSDDMKANLKVPSNPGAKPFAIVIPIRKDAEWWGLDQQQRAAMMKEHTEAALPYHMTVKRKLYHATGLDDFDFITYFETDKLEDFHNLLLALEKVNEFRHNRRVGHPTLLGTVKPLDEILEMFAR
ncbi:MAG: chlorite dismutase family protein [Nitrospiraceae bacterium]